MQGLLVRILYNYYDFIRLIEVISSPLPTATTPDVPVADLDLITAPDVLVAGLVPFVQKNSKPVEKTRKETERKALKRKRDANKSSEINIPIVCNPEKYPLYNPPSNTVGQSIVQYLNSLQQNDVTARPTN